ncbi:uncharacterized protein LOC108195665 isoform X1 [Daucus carota subsp. sativus]|uniref:uncharacterized protein LOC108195665 isoform X1 n=2 Tax=Daucus carota subsp. sativus TaxID=79200 RepID=UPI0030833D73
MILRGCFPMRFLMPKWLQYMSVAAKMVAMCDSYGEVSYVAKLFDGITQPSVFNSSSHLKASIKKISAASTALILMVPILPRFCEKIYRMAEGGSDYCSKKSDDFCGGAAIEVCEFVATLKFFDRFVSLEQELAQIKTSAVSNGSTKYTGGSYGADNAMQDEDSKDHLKHVLETQKKLYSGKKRQ